MSIIGDVGRKVQKSQHFQTFVSPDQWRRLGTRAFFMRIFSGYVIDNLEKFLQQTSPQSGTGAACIATRDTFRLLTFSPALWPSCLGQVLARPGTPKIRCSRFQTTKQKLDVCRQNYNHQTIVMPASMRMVQHTTGQQWRRWKVSEGSSQG